MNSSLKNMVFLVAPCLVLLGAGFVLKNRKPGALLAKEPFKTSIKAVRTITPLPYEVQQGYDTKVEVELGSTGAEPDWWQKGLGSYSGSSSGRLVLQSASSSKLVQIPMRWAPHREPISGKWVSTYLLKLLPLNRLQGEIRLRDQIKLLGDKGVPLISPLWLDSVVRPTGAKVKPPQVSRNPRLKLTRLSLEQMPPVDLKGAKQYRLRMWLDKQKPLQGLDLRGIQTTFHVRDATGKVVELYGETTQGAGEFEGLWYQITDADIPQQDNRRNYIVHEFPLPTLGAPFGGPPLTKPLKHPLTIEGEAQFADFWPLFIKVPLTDAKGNVILTSHPKPAFHVVSTAVHTFNASSKGYDTRVRIDLAPNDPNQDVSMWKWNARFSPRVQPAKGAEIWSFPFPGSRHESNVEYEVETQTNHMILRYDLMLGAIPPSVGKLTFKTDISANGSAFLPVEVVVRAAPPGKQLVPTPTASSILAPVA